MHCQVIYWDVQECPPLVMKREGRGKKMSAPKPLPAAVVSGAAEAKPPAPVTLTVNNKEKANVKV
jgi:hypothetical protein